MGKKSKYGPLNFNFYSDSSYSTVNHIISVNGKAGKKGIEKIRVAPIVQIN